MSDAVSQILDRLDKATRLAVNLGRDAQQAERHSERLGDTLLRLRRAYVIALNEHRAALTARGVKAKDLPALPSTFEEDSKALTQEIPF